MDHSQNRKALLNLFRITFIFHMKQSTSMLVKQWKITAIIINVSHNRGWLPLLQINVQHYHQFGDRMQSWIQLFPAVEPLLASKQGDFGNRFGVPVRNGSQGWHTRSQTTLELLHTYSIRHFCLVWTTFSINSSLSARHSV